MSKPTSISRARQKALGNLSPFEFKDELINLAQEAEREDTAQFLNAGLGNLNWICTTPRDAFGTLLRFGLEESRRDVSLPVPDRMLRCSERIVHEFIAQEMCAGRPPEGKFDLFAVDMRKPIRRSADILGKRPKPT
jgi:hypothetical protein